jgi:hypothetical protein
MKNRFTLFLRGVVYYIEDRSTGQQKSLQTRSEAEARKLVQARHESLTQPLMNLALAKTYLAAQDPKLITRTWADVMKRFCDRSNDNTRMRHERVVRTKTMQFLKGKRLVETTADDIFEALKLGSNSTIGFLQTLHNDALGMGWLPSPVLPRKLWPKMTKKDKRAITEAEHIQLLGAVDDEWRLYFQLLWFVGAAQTDAANLTSANIDWQSCVLKYERQKLNGRSLPPACLVIGKGLEVILRQLPSRRFI